MVYHRMCGQQPAWIAAVCEDVRAATDRPVWPIIQSVDEPLGMTPEEYGVALETALAAGEGALIYNLRGLEHEARRAATSVAFAAAR
jgi:actin-like ATPase involved in cell morphogenesis